MRYVQFFKTQLRNFINGVPEEQVEQTFIPLNDGPVVKAAADQPRSSQDEIFDDLRTPMSGDRYTEADLRDFLDLYSHHTWCYRCVNTIATTAASVDFVFKRGTNELSEDERGGGFLKQPNFFMTWYDLIETTFLHLELAGNSFWEIQRVGKDIVNIFPLRPDRITIVPDAKKRVLQYEYNVNGTIIRFTPDEILHFKYADAKAEFLGISPASAARNTITIDFYAQAWNKEFFVRGAEPGGVIETENTLTDLAYNRLQKLWQKRHRGKPHEIALLEEGAKYKQITSSHADMQYLEGRAKNAQEIAGAYNVPPFYLGLEGGGTPNEQKKRFYQTNITPKLSKFGSFLNSFLFGPMGLKIVFLTKSLPMIIEDEEAKARIAQSNVSFGVWTQNEARKFEWDLPPKPWGNTWYQPVGLFDTLKPETRPVAGGMAGEAGKGDMPGNANVTSGVGAGLRHPAQVRGPKEAGSRAMPEPDEVLFEKEEESRGLTPIYKMEVAEPDWGDRAAVSDWSEYMFWKQQAGNDELNLRRSVKGFFKEQGARILPRVAHFWPIQKAEDSTNARRDAILQILRLIFDDTSEEGALRSFMVPIAEQTIQKYGQNLLTQKNVPIPFLPTDPNVKQWMSQYTASQVRHITETTRALLQGQLMKAAEEGEAVKAVLGRIRDVFEGDISVARAQKIARTELVTMSNNARQLAAEQSGVLKKKRWISEQLPTTRQEPKGANHMLMHGVTKAIDEPFEAPNRKGGVDLMDCPGDNNGSAENVCNCVCVCSYFTFGAFQDLFGGDEGGDEPPPAPPVEPKPVAKEAPAAEPVVEEPPPPPAPPVINVTVNPAPVTVNVPPAPTPAADEGSKEEDAEDETIVDEVAFLAGLAKALEDAKDEPK